ncbi:uracil-DNA glycosylase [Methanonatronarchaeum sp. AMET6-2]|uniref:uracil-DNA glycosylase n=1 Tax=Methanonatronarchaeum sp. AMET6-2 TaxID=2933293 RepID=UPI0011FD4D51|nr:uracil-DNA glycosylase [Methanonatronarchaeum sp. AMET6-2]RZN62605.1 MAG: uracil-DNA glycosylase [Methanonatronarchaeia archaeon]UOY09401.1 uracil-DNA glycosylase [Methanonatronarchaeum sp. AMET6-2]
MEIKDCHKCKLSKNRTNIVTGHGPTDTQTMIVGEAPGKQEDEKGKPFVGKAGKILTQTLQKNQIKRNQTYITNIVKCRPPNNRNPKQKEMDACKQHLKKQIKEIDPTYIICLGKVASQRLTGQKITLKNKHGTFTRTTQEYGKRKAYITYHPAATIYNKNLTKTIQQDIQKFKQIKQLETQ